MRRDVACEGVSGESRKKGEIAHINLKRGEDHPSQFTTGSGGGKEPEQRVKNNMSREITKRKSFVGKRKKRERMGRKGT